MKLTIVVPDSVVGVDGIFREVDLAQINPAIHAVQWDGSKGHVEFNDGKPNLEITSISPYSWTVTAWNALTPAPPAPPTEAELINKATEAVRIAIQSAIDEKAKSFGFISGGNALMLYAGFANPFQPLAQTFATWEASVWYEAELYKAEVIAGNKPMLSPSEAVALMPVYPA